MLIAEGGLARRSSRTVAAMEEERKTQASRIVRANQLDVDVEGEHHGYHIDALLLLFV